MSKYLVSNIADRRHSKIFGAGSFFDLESSQHGWDEFSQVQVADGVEDVWHDSSPIGI
ncbi:hypothetical protein ACED29_21025 [Shewanella sp. 5S214]|uniref:hypothetical protein n=1 Tax=Shewanella sp. 5S214 TaxID=3229999 RepID=UPI00352BF1F0